MEVDKEILISKVFMKGAIWDKRLKEHANRSVIDKAWKEIDAEMGFEDDGVLRKKWKYLRDQFAIEIGKFPACRSGDPGGHFESKGPYFKPLMFLVGIVKPRPTSSNLKQQCDIEMVAHTAADRETENTESVPEVEASDTLDTGKDETIVFSRKRKRNKCSNSRFNQQVLSIEEKKASLLDRVLEERRQEESDDELFFRSLLPYINKISPHLKLRFRNRVQQLVDEFVFQSDQQILYNNTPSSSYGGLPSE